MTAVRKELSTIAKRARARYLTYPLAQALADLKSPLEKSYRNTIYCQQKLQEEPNGKLVTRYCGNRWCIPCNRIRTGRAINRYEKELSSWTDLQFVTLTIPNVKGEELAGTIRKMIRTSAAVVKAVKVTDRLAMRSVRKIECTFNTEKKTYHPHLHFMVAGKAAALALVDRWLDRYPDATREAQDVRAVDIDGGWKELFKYFTKLTTRNRIKLTHEMIAPAVLDTIFLAMRRMRVYQPMGFVLPKELPDEEGELQGEEAIMAPSPRGYTVAWQWHQGIGDWVDATTGDTLSGWIPPAKLRAFVEGMYRPPGGGSG